MLDTVILFIPKPNFQILKHERFFPTTKFLGSSLDAYSKHVNNPTAADKQSGIYLPRLTVNKRGGQISLKVEFSVPKILYGNNLDEVDEADFPKVVELLKTKLWHMGVAVSASSLMAAEVSSFHPSKNIPLRGGYTSSFVIRELHKVNLTRKLDFDKVDFRNEGQSMQLYSVSHALVVYDKLVDLAKTESRAIDKDQTKGQQSLLDLIAKKDPKTEILRIEIRLSKKAKMNQVLTKLGYKTNPTFQQIFKKDVCRKVLQDYWQSYLEPDSFLFDGISKVSSVFISIVGQNAKIKPKQALYLTGLNLVSKEFGLRQLRSMIEAMGHKKNWERIRKDCKLFKPEAVPKLPNDFVKIIKDTIAAMDCYKTGKQQVNVKPQVHNPHLEYH